MGKLSSEAVNRETDRNFRSKIHDVAADLVVWKSLGLTSGIP